VVRQERPRPSNNGLKLTSHGKNGGLQLNPALCGHSWAER